MAADPIADAPQRQMRLEVDRDPFSICQRQEPAAIHPFPCRRRANSEQIPSRFVDPPLTGRFGDPGGFRCLLDRASAISHGENVATCSSLAATPDRPSRHLPRSGPLQSPVEHADDEYCTPTSASGLGFHSESTCRSPLRSARTSLRGADREVPAKRKI